MAVYLFEIFMVFALKHIFKAGIRFENKRIGKNELYLITVFLMLGCVAAFRGSSVGTDTAVYCTIYQKIAHSASIQEALDVSTISSAPFYVLYTYLISRVVTDPQISLMINSIIIFCGFYRFIKKESCDYVYSTFLFIALTMYFESMNGMRQFVAVSLALNAFLYLKEEIRSNKGWLIFILAVLTHSTALAFAVSIFTALFVRKSKNIDKVIGWSIVVSVAIALSFSFLVRIVSNVIPSFTQYIDGTNKAQFFINSGSGRIIILYAMLFLILVIFLYFFKKNKSLRTKIDYTYIPSLFFCTIMGMFFSKNVLFNRILWFFMPMFMIFIPNTYSLLRKKNKTIMYCVTGCLLMVYCVFHLLEDKSGIIPYSLFGE